MLQQFSDKNKNLIVSINGVLVHRDKAGISPFDSAVQGGDAVWEGLRLYNDRIFRLREHLDRLRDSALALAFRDIPTHEAIVGHLRAVLEANGMRDGVHVRLTLTRGVKYTSGMDPRINNAGPTLIILPEWKPPVYSSGGIRLITSTMRRPGPDVMDPKIHHCNLINSILAKIQANTAGADDALMLDSRGFIAETNATHVFLVSHGVVLTSHVHACPEGITRAVVIDLCRANGIPLEVRDLSLSEAYRADEMFCTGTMGELTSVLELDSRRIGTGEPGPLTQQLARLFRAKTASEGELVVE
ncbi:MAG: aminotransferase IV [Planctomycetes bacterium]|nr:aminotransferase IV [Planctomycetota bacterium]